MAKNELENLRQEHHKAYGASSPAITLPLEHILGEADPSQHGLVLMRPGADTPYASVRPPFWRSIKNDPLVHEEDLVYLYGRRVDRSRLEVPRSQDLTVGSELETLTLHERVRQNGHEQIRPDWTGYELDSKLKALGIPTSPEVWKYMLELNGLPSASSKTRHANFVDMAKAMAQASLATGGEVKFLPTSSQPFIAHPEDIHPHPYVRRMVNEYLTFPKTQDLGTSFQVHVEMLDINSAIDAINSLRLLPPLFMAMALNGPFLQHEYSGLLSSREQARRKLGTGGNMPELPEWDELLEQAVQKLKDEPIPSLPRAISQHNDFRFRPDITPHGTIEFMFLDNPGGNLDKMLMFQELFRLTTWRLYDAYVKSEILPEVLFGNGASRHLTENKKVVERVGNEALIRNGLENPATVQAQIDHLLRWVSDSSGFSDNPEYPLDQLTQEAERSLTVPKFNGLESRSMASFYQTGVGTPAHYQVALFEHLVHDLGMSETQAINTALVDYADCYQEYLEQTAK